eukprot:3938158-Rhodomonas_salina.1
MEVSLKTLHDQLFCIALLVHTLVLSPGGWVIFLVVGMVLTVSVSMGVWGRLPHRLAVCTRRAPWVCTHCPRASCRRSDGPHSLSCRSWHHDVKLGLGAVACTAVWVDGRARNVWRLHVCSVFRHVSHLRRSPAMENEGCVCVSHAKT